MELQPPSALQASSQHDEQLELSLCHTLLEDIFPISKIVTAILSKGTEEVLEQMGNVILQAGFPHSTLQ